MFIWRVIGVTCVLSACNASNEANIESKPCVVVDSTTLLSHSFKLISGGPLLICDDDTLIAPIVRGRQQESLRLRTSITWKNPLVKVCIAPLELSQRGIEPWHNVIRILTPFVSDDLNYAISLRSNGSLIINKDVTDHTVRDIDTILPGTPISLAVSTVRDASGGTTIRAWAKVGSCNVDTSVKPSKEAYEARSNIQEGAIELRTNFLSHHVLDWSGCESAQNGTQCAQKVTQLVPLR